MVKKDLNFILLLSLLVFFIPRLVFAETADSKKDQKQLEYYQVKLAVAKELVRRNPEDADNWLKLGNAYSSLGNDEESFGAFQKAIGIAPFFETSYALLANLYIKEKKYKEAIFQLEETIKIIPQSPLCHIILSSLYIRQGVKNKDKVELEKGRKICLETISLLKQVGGFEKEISTLERRLKELDEFEKDMNKQ